MMEMEDNSEDVMDSEEEDNKHSDPIVLTDNEDSDDDTNAGNVCELESMPSMQSMRSNQMSTVVPHLMSDSRDGSRDDDTGDGQPDLISDDTLSQTQNVKIVKVVPLPHARSEVWSYFGFIADDEGEIQDKKKAICKICASTLAYSGNTTNLFTHLKAMHPEAQPQKLAPTNRTPRTGKKFGKRKADVLDSPSGPLIVRAITYASPHVSDSMFDEDQSHTGALLNTKAHKSQSNAYNTGLSDSHNNNVLTADDITNSIVNWLVKDCRPICVVEGKGFQELLRQLAPGYVTPDSRRLTTAVKKKYDEVRRDLILRAMQDE